MQTDLAPTLASVAACIGSIAAVIVALRTHTAVNSTMEKALRAARATGRRQEIRKQEKTAAKKRQRER